MKPILIKIGPATIYSWGVMFVLAFAIGFVIAIREGKRKNIPQEEVTNLALYLLVGGLVFARLIFAIFNAPLFYLNDPWRIFMIWEGGLAFHGALLGGILAGYLFSRVSKIPLGKLADLVTPSLALGLAIGRIGCFLGGHCEGVATNLPWAVNFPGLVGRRHPTQLYELVLDLGVFVFVWARRNKIKFDGHLFLVYLILYSFVRMFVEIFRDSQALFGPVTYAQGISALIIVGASLIIRRHTKVSAQVSSQASH